MAEDNAARPARASEALGSFLGTGWAFPPRFGARGGELTTATGVADVHESLQILLGTRLGERVMRADFGCNLDEVMFEEIDQNLVNRVTSLVNDAILYHEPRVELLAVNVSRAGDPAGLLLIRLDYRVRGVNSRYNMVFPFYANEASQPLP